MGRLQPWGLSLPPEVILGTGRGPAWSQSSVLTQPTLWVTPRGRASGAPVGSWAEPVPSSLLPQPGGIAMETQGWTQLLSLQITPQNVPDARDR